MAFRSDSTPLPASCTAVDCWGGVPAATWLIVVATCVEASAGRSADCANWFLASLSSRATVWTWPRTVFKFSAMAAKAIPSTSFSDFACTSTARSPSAICSAAPAIPFK